MILHLGDCEIPFSFELAALSCVKGYFLKCVQVFSDYFGFIFFILFPDLFICNELGVCEGLGGQYHTMTNKTQSVKI